MASRRLLPSFRAQIPTSVEMTILYDRSESIRASVRDLEITLLISVVLVILVIFFFLRNVSATIIPSLAMPLSIVGTFSVMYLLGYSLDNLSLMALTLSVGFVVDDAIVMLENIVRHIEMGKGRLQAALDGSREIGFTILSMTLSLAAVFIPLLFMGGIMGRLLHEFAVTITVTILLSGFVSLSLSPMLCSRFLKPPRAGRQSRLYALSERFFDGMYRGYKASLGWVIRHGLLMMLLFVVLLVATGYLFVIIPKDFIPSQDTSQIFGFTEGAQDISFDIHGASPDGGQPDRSRRTRPSRRSCPPSARSDWAASTRGSSSCTSSPLAQRPRRRSRSSRGSARKLAQIPGINVFLQNPPVIRVGGRLTQNLYQFTIQGPDTAELYQWGPQIEAALRKSARSAGRDQRPADQQPAAARQHRPRPGHGPGCHGRPDRERPLQRLWLPADLHHLHAQQRIPGDPGGGAAIPEGPVGPLDALRHLQRPATSSPWTPWPTRTRTTGPLTVNHTGQLPSVTISFNLRPGVALSQAIAEIDRAVGNLRLPASLDDRFPGPGPGVPGLAAGDVAAAAHGHPGHLHRAGHPLRELHSPADDPFGPALGGVGALLTLLLFHTDLSIYAFVGIIMLIGIVKKNAIMMIDFALAAERGEGKKPADAIFEGCLLRFRPIMMTTMAALMGTLPIALGFGAGAEARRPLGLAVVGGLVFSQFVTLYITPVIYIYLDRVQNRLARRLPVQSYLSARIGGMSRAG